MRIRLLVVGVLAVTAGCSGLGVVGGGPATPTLTPVPVPETTASEWHGGAGTGKYPPGVSPNGTVDAATLAAAHYAALERRSYTRYERRVISVRQDGGVTVERINATTWVGDGGAYRRDVHRTRRRENDTAAHTRISTLVVDGQRYTYWSANGSVTVRRAEDARPPRPDLRALLSVNVTSVRLTGYGSEPFVRIVGHGKGATGVPTDLPYRINALVSSQGVVRQLIVTLDPGAVGRGYDMVYVIRYRALDETVVPRPDWVDRATLDTET